MYTRNSSFTKVHKLLAVDDFPDNLFLMEAILGEDKGYEVACVDSGEAALEAIAQSPPDLILLDIMMPSMTGYEVAHQVRQNPELPYIPIILLTAHAEIDQPKAVAAGADGFIRKPFDIDYLIAQVRETLQKVPAFCG